MRSNFEFLSRYWPEIAEIGMTAEACLYTSPQMCITKLWSLAQRIVGLMIDYENISVPAELNTEERIKVLRREGRLPEKIDDILFAVRTGASDAAFLGSQLGDMETFLRMAHSLSKWFMEVYGNWNYMPEDFVMPENNGNIDLESQINQLKMNMNASEMPASQRSEKADMAAENIALTQAEHDYLMSRQVRVESNVLPVVHYALQQNKIPVVRSLSIVNNSDEPLENIQLVIHAKPDLCIELTRNIDYIPANSVFEVRDVRLMLNAEYLVTVMEKVTGLLYIQLKKGEKTIFTDINEITILAMDEWHGYTYYPDLIASFVTPNHPEVYKINAEAAKLLEEWTKDPSLDAYQSNDPGRVLSQAAAVFGAIQKQNIVYAELPASFESVGQRVRLCDAVMAYKMGNCLDLSLLYASCLESIGLHPILIIKKGHIFVGVWLEDLSFPESVQDDTSLITKRLASGVNEIAVIESTLFAAGKGASFDDAKASAEKEFTGGEPVEYIIDIARARLSGITPLPVRVASEGGWKVEREQLDEGKLTSAPTQFGETINVDNTFKKEAFSKKVQWERKLLDLGLRNNLINLRMSKVMIPILTNSLDALEDALSKGNDFAVFPRPNEWHLPTSGLNFENMHDMGENGEIIKSEFKNNRLRSSLSELELTRNIKTLYRTAKASLEENGANTLYLALGLLRWYENKRSVRARYAPLILIPVDIVRKSASQGYIIRLRDDEPQMNITLLEMLKQEFGIIVNGLDPLPMDEHGIDIRKTLTTIRQAVMEQNKWDVLESAYLGTFSFSQFVMWNDIRNRADDLAKNKIVRSLMDGKLAWEARQMTIGERVSENDVFLPMAADASQLFAIREAVEGESFVLHGPPGTGKSQTITTLIANALAQGKTVLFVAEKMAALEVVQKRLKKIGLAPFCLELHSNKAKKKEVLEQLRIATEVTKYTTAEEYEQKAASIAALRNELDEYAGALHKKQICGMTLYDLISSYEHFSSADDIENFPHDIYEKLTPEMLDKQNTVAERLVAAAKQTGHPYGNPLARVGCAMYSQNIRGALNDALDKYESALNTAINGVNAFAESIGMAKPADISAYNKLISIANELNEIINLPRAWSESENLDRTMAEICQMANHYIKANELHTQLSRFWTDDFLKLDGKQLFNQFNEASGKWFVAKFFAVGSVVKQVQSCAKGKIDKNGLGQQFALLADYQAEKASGDALFAKYGNDLHNLYVGDSTDWKSISELTAEMLSSAKNLRDLCGNDDIRKNYGGVSTLADTINAARNGWNDMQKEKDVLYSLLTIRENNGENWGEDELQMCRNIRDNADNLKEWITWNGIRAEALEVHLAPVVNAYEKGLAHDKIIPAYKKAVFMLLASRAIENEPVLNNFSGAVFREKIGQFKRLDSELAILTQKEIFCRLASRVPDFTKEAANSSELGILQRAIRSNGRGTSIRRIFEQIPNLLPRLCPCMLMSPISAAQYLDPNREHFDMVVFDEASQLPTCKAVGALARGKNAVVVGDPKQMPPTSFFATNIVDEDNLDIEDLESILDDCLALNMPQTHLLWHYRSRHESLIAFSNSQFYENKLYTFPSVNDRESKVTLVHVDGLFERGKSRQNRAEAEAIVAELIRRAHDEEASKLSVGVVTFNISQQNLIDDLLSEAFKTDPVLEKWAFESEEPVFIKNLESVQGDERDVILFSIGYGPDKDGKVYMNFGPLNRDGGWRRLNVAVSRSRHEMIVYSTLTPDQINLSRTSAEGVAALKAFLEYAGGSKLAVDSNTAKQQGRMAGISDNICAFLKEKGYETQKNVGHSEYKIDIGVVDPENSERYMMGILLDGASYGASKTTKDREVAQISVLEGLGWNIHRVWSMDWWDNSRKELDRIVEKLENIKNKVEIKEEPAPESAQPVKPALNDNAKKPKMAQTDKHEYVTADLPQKDMTADEFLAPLMKRSIASRIGKVVKAEAPVMEGQLLRRVINSYGIERSGSRIRERFDEVMDEMTFKTTIQNGEKVYWNDDQDPENYVNYRVSNRDIRDVPYQEIMCALCIVLREQISMTREDLARETARKLGYSRMTKNVLAGVDVIITEAENTVLIEKSGNEAYILTNKGTNLIANV